MARKILILSIVYLFTVVSGQERNLTEACLGCICDAASGCDTSLKCVGDICGPFKITLSYWTDGGKPTLDGASSSDDNAYTECLADAMCAARAVQGYMTKYAQDCNGDGDINCEDFARIHKLGPNGCSGPLDPEFQKTYDNCRKVFRD